ncbi:MAG: hypothetical protein WDW38_003894 [Sanguina aurantia]
MNRKQLMPWWRGSEDDESSDTESREGNGNPWGGGELVPHQTQAILSLLSLPSNKLKTAAAAFTFVAAAGYISAMAVCGLIAILVTGAVVAFCVLATVFICTTLITLIITGVPVGYALFQIFMIRRMQAQQSQQFGGSSDD